VVAAFGPGAHASTFGGTPIVSAAALETLRVLTEEKIIEQCARVGAYFKEKLTGLKTRHAVVTDVRGRGLLLGMELATAGQPIVAACQAKGFLINCIQDNILRFAPPLIITTEEIDALIKCLDGVLTE
jgi:acetylornithine/succinyldiaminopimelate/putrescine aminotransferase